MWWKKFADDFRQQVVGNSLENWSHLNTMLYAVVQACHGRSRPLRMESDHIKN